MLQSPRLPATIVPPSPPLCPMLCSSIHPMSLPLFSSLSLRDLPWLQHVQTRHLWSLIDRGKSATTPSAAPVPHHVDMILLDARAVHLDQTIPMWSCQRSCLWLLIAIDDRPGAASPTPCAPQRASSLWRPFCSTPSHFPNPHHTNQSNFTRCHQNPLPNCVSRVHRPLLHVPHVTPISPWQPSLSCLSPKGRRRSHHPFHSTYWSQNFWLHLSDSCTDSKITNPRTIMFHCTVPISRTPAFRAGTMQRFFLSATHNIPFIVNPNKWNDVYSVGGCSDDVLASSFRLRGAVGCMMPWHHTSEL